jgi:hypothetical protein
MSTHIQYSTATSRLVIMLIHICRNFGYESRVNLQLVVGSSTNFISTFRISPKSLVTPSVQEALRLLLRLEYQTIVYKPSGDGRVMPSRFTSGSILCSYPLWCIHMPSKFYTFITMTPSDDIIHLNDVPRFISCDHTMTPPRLTSPTMLHHLVSMRQA